MSTFTFRPLVWTGPRTPDNERRSQWTFKAGWEDTLALLDRELYHLGATERIIEADFRERDLRRDGLLRADARPPEFPGVKISFNTPRLGRLEYATDAHVFWQHNVRAIALSLEALRAVDRYGTTAGRQQYTGFRAIGAGPTAMPATTAMTRQEAADLLAAAAIPGQAARPAVAEAVLVPNRTNGTSRDVSEPMETLVGNAGSGGLGVLSTGVVPFRKHTTPTVHGEAMPTVTSDQVPGLLTAAGVIKNNGAINEARYRAHPVSNPLGTVVGSAASQALLFSGWFKQNGTTGTETAPHPVLDPFGTLTSRDTTGILAAEWRAALDELKLEDCYFRMMFPHEVGRGCGFDVDFPGHDGTFIVWGSARDQVDGYGNAVSPQVGEWIGGQLRAVLHGEDVAA